MKNEALIRKPTELNAFTKVLYQRLTDGTNRPVLVTLRDNTLIEVYWDPTNSEFWGGDWCFTWTVDGSCSYTNVFPRRSLSDYDMIECND